MLNNIYNSLSKYNIYYLIRIITKSALVIFKQYVLFSILQFLSIKQYALLLIKTNVVNKLAYLMTTMFLPCSRRRATRSAVLGWVLKRLFRSAPLKGLMMKRCAVA